jgi:hypothetical protein
MLAKMPSQSGIKVLVCCMVALMLPGSTQDLATPVAKVTQMLEEMKVKSEALMKEAEVQMKKVVAACDKTVLGKMDEVSALKGEIEKLEAEVLQLTTDIQELVKQINDDEQLYESDSALLEDNRKTRRKEESEYQRDLSEYTVAMGAVNRAIEIMGKHGSFLQASQSRTSIHEARAALETVSRSIRHFSAYTPDTGGLAKDEKMFDDFNSLTTNDGAYKSQAGKEKGVLGILETLGATFDKAKTELMSKEKDAKASFTKMEENLQTKLETTRTSISTNKGIKAQKEESKTTKTGELNQASINKAATEKFLKKTEQTCADKITRAMDMENLRKQEIKALTKAIEIIKGTVTTNKDSLNAKAFAQIPLHEPPHTDNSAQRFVKSLDRFITRQAGALHSKSLVLLGNRMRVLAAHGGAPSEALNKVKTMISDLIAKMQADSAAEATQKAWCDDELAKNEKETKTADAGIETNTAAVAKIKGDTAMLEQEITTLQATLKTSEAEKQELIEARTKEKETNAKTVKEANESIEAVDAAITVLTDYYADAEKKASALVQRKASRKQTPNETPEELTEAETAGPQSTEGGNVISMLEVVRDNYKTLVKQTEAAETKAEQESNEQIKDLEVMLASAKVEEKGKQELVVDNTKMLPLKETDLKSSNTALSDAKTNYENLKAPCLNGNAAEQRKEQLEAELAALKEALTMIEEYNGSFLLQEEAKASFSSLEDITQVPAESAQLEKVAKLLDGIKKDVEADLKADTAAYEEMEKWCTATISEVEAALKTQRDRDAELVTAIEVSTQQKTVLTTQLASLNTEVTKNTESMNQMTQLRSNDKGSFQNSEKETMLAIASLRSAISVLKAKYDEFDKADKRDFKAEQDAIKSANLIHLADNVAKAMKLLPVSEFNKAVSGDTGAILQGFLSKPNDILFPGAKHAGLTQTGSQVVSKADGKTILGILEQLMETFTADLAAMQDKEKLGIETYTSTKTAKESQISAMQANIETKQEQLAHYTTMHAQAKEDLVYLRETTKNDAVYLQGTRDQCASSANEFKIRKQTRTEEIAALAEGIDILTAGGGLSSNTAPTPAPSKALIHHKSSVRKVFVHHHDLPKKRAVLKVAAPTNSKSAGQSKIVAAIKTAVASAPAKKAFLQGPLADSPLRRSLAALEAQVKVAHRQLSEQGPLTGNAIKSVVTQVDVVVVQLRTQKKLEIKKKETCVSEQNQATEQRQRRITDQAKLQNEITTLMGNIKKAEEEMAAIAKQIEEIKDAQEEAKKTREADHEMYKESVKEQIAQQKKLHEAIAALKNFYKEKAEKAKTAFLQAPNKTQSSLQMLMSALEQQLSNAGQSIEAFKEPTAEFAKQTSQYDAWAHDTNIKTICGSDFNSGSSALRFLAESKATLYEFDMGVHPEGKIAAAFLMDKFPGRIHTLWGDSAVVMPLFHQQRPEVHCDLMIVDGGHHYEAILADLKNFAKMASPKHTVVLDNTPCTDAACAGPDRAWRELVEQGCIVQTQSVSMSPSHGFSVGSFAACSNHSAGRASAGGNHSTKKASKKVVVKSGRIPKVENMINGAAPIKLVAGVARQEPDTRTDEQKALDAEIEKNKDTTWGDVKGSKAKRTAGPKGFSKPLKTHTGGKGIIGILQIILEESEALIEEDVKAEQNEVDKHLDYLAKTKQTIAVKDKETVMLEQVKSDNELKQTQTEQQLKTVETEIEEIESFSKIVDKQCTTFLSNFNANQAARAEEISDTIKAKEVLLGMVEQDSGAVLLQLSQKISHIQRINE